MASRLNGITLERRNNLLREQILSFKSRPWEIASSSEEANRNHRSYSFCKHGKKHGCVPIHLKTYVVGRALDKRECLTIFFIFSDKSYVVTPHLNSLVETVQMRSHNIRFYAELTKIIPYYQQIFPPIKSSVWVYMNWKFGLLSEWEITLERRNFFLREQILSFKSRPWERASSSEEANRNHKSYFFFCKNGKKHGCVPIHLWAEL